MINGNDSRCAAGMMWIAAGRVGLLDFLDLLAVFGTLLDRSARGRGSALMCVRMRGAQTLP